MKKTYFLGLFLLAALASSAQTSILSETFEGTAFPSTWSQVTNATDGGWLFGTSATLQYQNFAIPAHTKMVATNDWKCNCDKSNDILKTPALDLSTYTNVFMSFDSYFLGVYYTANPGSPEVAKVVASTDGGTTWTDVQQIAGAGSWTKLYLDLSAYAGNNNVIVGFKYNDAGLKLFGWAIDNVEIYEPLPVESQLSTVSPAAGSPKAYAVTGGPATISGTITNNGSSTITDITIKYSDGTNTYTDTKSGLSVASFETYNFTHSTPYTVNAGNNPLTVWIEQTGDGNTMNDTMPTVIKGVPFLPAYRVVVEEATGTWCGWCPRGAVYMDSMYTEHPDNSVCIAVHNGDPMTNATYDGAVSGLVPGYPSTLFNRGTVADPSAILKLYNDHYEDFGFANLAMNCSYDPALRKLTVVTDAHFATSLNGDYRMAMVVTEDNVTGTASGYNQTNYYSGGANGPMGGFESMPNPVPAADMEYDFVARTIVGGFNGQTGSLPATITEGGTYQYTFNYTIPAAYNPYEMNAIILLIDKNNSSILNGNIVPLNTIVSGVASQASAQLLTLSPNPGTVLNASLMLNNTANISIKMTNVLGQTVLAEQHMDVPAGANSFQIDGTQMNDGIYVVDITADNVSVYSGKVMIVH